MRGPEPDRLGVILKGGLAAAAGVAIVLLLMQIAHQLLDAPEVAEPSPEEVAAEPPDAEQDAKPALVVEAIEPVRAKVVLDGETRFDGIICAGPPPRCPEPRVAFQPADRIELELTDLTRARVIYNGVRVDPLGNLSSKRRLVFIDDSTP